MKDSETGRAVKRLFTQIVAVTLSSFLAFGQAGRPVITPSGKTNTTVTTSGSVTNITTGTVRGGNAYNSFNNFNEPQGNTVNLFLPNGTTNLLNLVGSDTTSIDGTLNSILNGRIGGNVFFADPFGIIIGKTGVVNAGAFSATTPTSSFLSQFFDSAGNPSVSATASVLNGTIPITPNGLISVQGHVNATGNISLSGGSVVNSGRIQSGAVFSNSRPDFSDVVNVAGLRSGNAISVQNGNIEIQAVDDVENSGAITTNGGNNLNAGNIGIHAGGNIKMDPNSLVSASGQGQNSSGGQIKIFAENNSELDAGAVVTAQGGSSGNGGSVDFSAKGAVALKGGALNAGALNGTPGTVTVDPATIEISGTQTANDGTNVTLSADQSITVDPNATVTSQVLNGQGQSTANSGNISLTAPQITVGNGALVTAAANNGFSPGNITFTASQTDSEAAANAAANITIGNATIKGGNITLSAAATATGNFSGNSVVNGAVNDTSLGMLVNGPASVYTASSTSGVKIGDTSTGGSAIISASGNVTITSTATSSTTSKLTGTSGLAYGESDSNATATVSKNAMITASGTFALNSASNNTLNVSTTSDQQSASTAVVAFGKTSSVSTTQVDGTVEGSSVQIGATNTNSFSTSASATDFNTQAGNNGGAAIALGFYSSNATTNLTGSATADTSDATVASSSTNSLNVVNSSASVPQGGIKASIASAEGWFTNFGNKLSQATVTGFFKGSPTVPAVANSSQLGLAAGVSVAETGNTATTTVSGTVTADSGKATISSYASDNPQISAQGAASGQGTDFGGGIAVSDFGNTATTNVNGNAVVTSSSDASVTAEADIQNPALQTAGFIENDWELAANTNSGPATTWTQGLRNLITGSVNGVKTPLETVANPGALTTSFVNTGLSTSAGSGNNGIGVAGSINLMELTNRSTASVSGAAIVKSNAGNVNVTSTSTMTTFNVAGMAFGAGQIKNGNPGVQSNTSGGGSFDGENVTNTSAASVGDGATAEAQGGNLNVAATTNTLAIAIAQAGDKATQFGLTGTFNLVNLTNSAEAYIQSDATATASQDVNVNATNTLSDFAIAGAVGMGGQVQVGVSTNWNQINQTTLAYIGDPLDQRTIICTGCGVTAGGSVNVIPTSTENAYSITYASTSSGATGQGADGESSVQPSGQKAPSASGSSNAAANNNAGGGSYGFGVSGEIAFTQFGDSSNPGIITKGFINNGAAVTANSGNPNGSGSVNVTSTDTSFSVAAALADASGSQGALAGGYGQNTINKEIEAFTDNATISGNGFALSAVSNDSLYAVSAGGAVNSGNTGAIAGSVNNNTVTNTVNASIGDNTSATNIGSGGITVNASEGSNGDQLISVVGTTGASTGGAGIGAAIDIGNYTNNVTASIGNANLSAAGNIKVTSSTNVSYVPIAVSLGLGSDFGASGSLAFEQITDTTTSSVGGSVSTNDNLLIGSTDSSTALMVAGGLGVGGSAGVSVSGIIPVISRTTESEITDGANVTGLGNGTAVSYDGQTANGILLDAQAKGGSTAFQNYVGVGALSGSISAAGAVIINPIHSLLDDTEANIGANANVNQTQTGAASNQSVTLIAGDNAGIQDVAGSLSIGGDLGLGVGFDDTNPSWTVKTSIGSGANVNALNNVIASSNLQNSINSYVVSVAGSGGVSGSGAVTIVNDTSNTSAYIDTGATVSANNNVELAANRATNLSVADGGAALAVFGVINGAVANVTDNNTTQAYVGSGASVTALAQGTGISVPVDFGGLPGNGTVSGLSVTATATDTPQVIVAGGGIAGGASVSGSVLENAFTETTSAKIDTSAVINGNNTGAGAAQAVNVFASDITNPFTAAAGALGAAGILGIGAALDFENIQKTTTAGVDSSATVNANGAINVDAASQEVINSYTASIGAGLAGLAGTTADYATHPVTIATNAYVNASSVNAGSLGVNANENLTLSAVTGEVTFGGVALGAATATIDADPTTSASVNGTNVTLSPSGTLSVISGYTSQLTATAASGSGGTFSGNAAFAGLTDNGTNSAVLGATIPQAGNIAVNATTNRTLEGTTGSLAVSEVGAGATIVNTNLGGSTTAQASGSIGQTSGQSVQGLSVAAADTDTGVATESAVAGGIGNGSDNQASTTLGGSVSAQILNNSHLSVAGTLGLNASAVTSGSSTANGLNIGGVSIGESEATTTVDPSISATVGQNATVGGNNVSIGAAYNYGNGSPLMQNTAYSEATSSVGAVGVGVNGSSSSADSSPVVQVSFGQGSTVSATQALTVDSLSGNQVASNANGNAYATIAASGGGVNTTSTINNNNTITTGSDVSLTAGGNLTLSAQSTNNITDATATGSQGAAISANDINTTATANLTDRTNSTIGASNTITGGPSATLLIQALANNQGNSNVSALAANAFGGTNTATASTNVNTGNTTEVSSNSTVQGGTVTLDAEVTNEQYTATAVSNTYTLHSDATADSNVEVTANVNANVDAGANLIGGNAINVKADQENLLGNSSATGKVVGAAGAPTANSDNKLNDNSNINIASGATLTSDTVNMEAIAPYDKGASYKQTASAKGDTAVVWVTETVEETVDEVFGWIPYVKEVTEWVTKTVEKVLDSDPTANQTGSFNPSNTITMNGTIVQAGGINPVLVAGYVNGTPTLTTDRNVNAAISGNTITVNDLLNQIQPTVSMNAPNGTVQGTFTVQRNTTWSSVDITNNTSDNLVINNIDPLTSSNLNSPDVSISAANNTSNFTFVTSGTGATNIDIQNNSGSNVTLAGLIYNPGGSTTVANTGGNILATGSELIKDTITNLQANSGNVGSSGDYVNVQMTAETPAGDSAPTALSVAAGQNVFVNAQLAQDVVNTAPASIAGSATITSVTAGGTVNLNLLQPEAIVYGVDTSGATPVLTTTSVATPGIYAITSISGAGGVNVNQAAGTMNVGTIASSGGNVNLTASSGDVHLGSVTANQGTTSITASGSIVDTNGGGLDISANSINLDATGGTIGTVANPLQIDSSVTSAGAVNGTASGGVYLNEVTGALNVGQIQSQTSDVILTSAGSILNGSNNPATVNITGNQINLTSSNGGIGSSATSLVINNQNAATTGNNYLTSSSAGDTYITESAGLMNVNTVTSSNGNVGLTAVSGDIDLGTISSLNGNDTLSASGSILNTSGNAATVNITGKSMNLSAGSGSIGNSNTALLINNQNAATTGSNMLTTSSAGDTYITESAGLMNVNTVTSSNGNVGLTTRSGDIDLGTVRNVNGNDTLLSSGSILNTSGNAATVNITGKNMNLTASGGSIGNSNTALVINNQNAATTGGNTLTTSSAGDTYITESAGLMNVKTITSSNGNVGLTTKSGDIDLGTVSSVNGNDTLLSSGSILNTSGNAATVNVTGKNMNLTASGGNIGNSNTALVINNQNAATTGSNTLTTSSAGDTYITESAGRMDVNTITSSNGNVGLTTKSGDIALGTVTAKKGNITLNAFGSILDISGGTATTQNLTGNNMSLTATNGSIGSSATSLFVNNQNPATVTNGVVNGSNYLNASAFGDIYVVEAPGNLLSHTISSANGNVNINVLNASESLGTVSVNKNLTLQVGGSALTIGTITGTTGIAGVKAPSPNNVSLIVAKAGGTLTVNNMSVFQTVTTQADNTYLNNVYFTNLANLTNAATWDGDHQAQSLQFNDTGYNGGIASNININILPCTTGCNTTPAIIFKDYWTNNGNVTAKEDWLEFVNTKVTGNATFQNYWENFVITSKGRTPPPSWYFFLIGDKFERNVDPYEKVSPARFLQLPNHYTWLQNNTVVFPYLLNYFGLPASQ
jgi:hypothetical protein